MIESYTQPRLVPLQRNPTIWFPAAKIGKNQKAFPFLNHMNVLRKKQRLIPPTPPRRVKSCCWNVSICGVKFGGGAVGLMS